MKKTLLVAGVILFAALLFDGTTYILSDPFGGVYQAIEERTDYDREELEFQSGGYSRSLFERSAHADFRVKGAAEEKRIHIDVWKPFHLSPWQVREFDESS